MGATTWFTAAMAVGGSLAGNCGLFFAARHGFRRFVKPPAPGRPQRFRGWFHRYGLVTVFIPALLPIPLPLKIFVISAGILHTPASHFVGVILLARAVLKEFIGLRVLAAALLIFAAGAVLVGGSLRGSGAVSGTLLVAAAALAWAVDNLL